MTSLRPEEVSCGICGNKNVVFVMDSTNTLGSPDLDTRPSEMMRSTLPYWVQRCNSCGYCASDLTQIDEDAREIVESEPYQAILTCSEYPEVAASFLALSHQEQSRGRFADAAWSAIHAAWTCDDENQPEAAIKCRLHGLSLIEQGQAQSQYLSAESGATEAITIDLMRRAGKFAEVLELIEKLDYTKFDEAIVQVIEYQRCLAEQHDRASHAISEATDGECKRRTQ